MGEMEEADFPVEILKSNYMNLWVGEKLWYWHPDRQQRNQTVS